RGRGVHCDSDLSSAIHVFAALPQHTAVRLCLTADSTDLNGGYASELGRTLISHIDQRRKGPAFPHCAAAKPQSPPDQTKHNVPSHRDPLHKAESRLLYIAAFGKGNVVRNDSPPAVWSAWEPCLRLSANVPNGPR